MDGFDQDEGEAAAGQVVFQGFIHMKTNCEIQPVEACTVVRENNKYNSSHTNNNNCTQLQLRGGLVEAQQTLTQSDAETEIKAFS